MKPFKLKTAREFDNEDALLNRTAKEVEVDHLKAKIANGAEVEFAPRASFMKIARSIAVHS